MLNIKVAFKLLDNGDCAPRNHQLVKWHMVYNVKMEGCGCKEMLVLGGHMTTAPYVVTYTSGVPRESVYIALILAGLNDL